MMGLIIGRMGSLGLRIIRGGWPRVGVVVPVPIYISISRRHIGIIGLVRIAVGIIRIGIRHIRIVIGHIGIVIGHIGIGARSIIVVWL